MDTKIYIKAKNKDEYIEFKAYILKKYGRYCNIPWTKRRSGHLCLFFHVEKKLWTQSSDDDHVKGNKTFNYVLYESIKTIKLYKQLLYEQT